MEPLVAWSDMDSLPPTDAALVRAPQSPSKRHALTMSVDASSVTHDAVQRGSLMDMDRVRLIKDDTGHSGFRTANDDLMLEQLLVDDPLVATLASVQQFATSSEEESSSDTNTHRPTTTTRLMKSDSQGTGKLQLKIEMEMELAQAAVAAVNGALVEDEIGLSPLEIRRKRNRESMQRARARQRSDIDSMKIAMRQLEAHFRQLSDQKEAQRIQHDESSSTLPLAHRPMDQVETEYRQLADASRRLKEEKFLLEKMLTEKTKTFRRLQQAMVDRTVELGITTPLTTPALAASSISALPGLHTGSRGVDFFTSITEQQADAAIKRCYEDIERLEKMSKPLRNAADQQSPYNAPVFPPTSTFGWSMLCHVLPDDGGFFVAFTKTFAHITPDDVMLKTWTLYSRPENNAGAEQRNGVLRMDTLQVVNENAYVAYRDAQHPSRPDTTLRAVFLRFRLQTEHGGYVIGRACMNPTNPELRALDEREGNIVYGDFSSWIEFRVPRDGNGDGCEVKFGAVLAYDTHEDMQLRLINALTTTIMWETTVIKPPFCLQTSPLEA